mgnify:CR=1 FL=1
MEKRLKLPPKSFLGTWTRKQVLQGMKFAKKHPNGIIERGYCNEMTGTAFRRMIRYLLNSKITSYQ